jgi:hypothetical protein
LAVIALGIKNKRIKPEHSVPKPQQSIPTSIPSSMHN